MQNKNLQMKRALRTALLVLLLSVAGMGKGYAYDFSAVCETGQTLYYNITDATNHYVALTYPGVHHAFWDGFVKPTGNIVLPETVQYNNVIYSVTEIGNSSFNGCSGITFISLPNTLIIIGRDAFRYCSSLTSITLPDSMNYIGQSAFQGCSNLEYTNYTGTLGQWCSIVFEGPSSNPVCYSHNLFINGEELTNAIIPETVTHIGNYAFWWCEPLVSLSIPETVTHIGINAFGECKGLVSIDIPQSIISIGIAAFAGCSNLEHISVRESNSYYDSRNNCNAIIETVSNTLIAGCKNTIIPESVTVIETLAFGGIDLQYISIPQFVTLIGERSFNNPSLNTVISYAATPPILVDNAFLYGTNCTLIVPCGYASAYEASDWANYFTTIEEDCASHTINIDEGNMSGGSVNTSVNSTNMGEEVQIIVTPEEGMTLLSLIVCNSDNPNQQVYVYPIGKSSLTYGFIMPPFDVIIIASFGPTNTIDENSEAIASVYPNPTNGKAIIETENLKHITIGNMLGQVIYDGNASSNTFEFDFSKHEAGVYLIRIETANGVAVKKVSVTR